MNAKDNEVIRAMLVAFASKDKLEEIRRYIEASTADNIPKKDLQKILDGEGDTDGEEGFF